jgi:hypothetical protein
MDQDDHLEKHPLTMPGKEGQRRGENSHISV